MSNKKQVKPTTQQVTQISKSANFSKLTPSKGPPPREKPAPNKGK